MTTAFTVVIPSRYASTRLPGKPLLDIAGKPMTQPVREQATKSNASPSSIFQPGSRCMRSPGSAIRNVSSIPSKR